MDIDFTDLGFGTNFGTLDWCIVIGYLIAIVCIGVYIRKYIASAVDFMVAGRGLKTYLAIATMIGTELGLAASRRFISPLPLRSSRCLSESRALSSCPCED